jgi:dihydrofolate reductase
MGKVIFDVSMSLDGFITAANVRPEAGLGDGGEQLHEWAFNSTDPRDQEAIARLGSMGAGISGRTTYDLSIPHWGVDGPSGPERLPIIVVSHTVPQDVPAGSVYTFVNGVEAALEKAKELAGDKDVYISGASVAQQYITLGLVDEIVIHLIPVLFGGGVRLIDDLAGKHVQLETNEVIETKQAIHLRFRVIK